MLSFLIALTLVLAVAVAVVGVVVVGMEGRGRARAPRVADHLQRAARHLNGDAEPPRRFAKLFS